MKRRIVSTDKVPPGNARISQAIVVGDIVFVSGMVAREPSGQTVTGGIVPQTTQVLENVRSCLEAAGSDMQNVVKMTCYLADMANFVEFTKVWESYFPTDPPTRTCIQTGLGKGFDVEIETIAVLKD